MEKYDNLGMVGEGSYGMVMKCRNRETGQIVAIKKFLDSEEDKLVKKIAAREIKMLKQLRHDNLVNLLEVFRRKKRLYLVFEFVDHTVLEDLENNPKGLDDMATKKILFQVLRGIEFCHVHNIIHRDIKPENVLVSNNGVVKLCDFGFARTLAAPGEVYTDYVATRWYRAPELLVGDTKYGRAVDVWAIGCLAAEMLTGDPLFPGDSDIDQLHHVVRCLGNLNEKYEHIFQRNPLFAGMRLPVARELVPLDRRLPGVAKLTMNFIKSCLRLDANDRPTSSALLRSEYFTRDSFSSIFMDELKSLIRRESERSGTAPHRTNATSTAQKTTKYELSGKNTTAGAVSVISSNANVSCNTINKATVTVTNANCEARKKPVCQSELVEDKSEPVPVKISTENKNKEELPQAPNSPVEYDEKQNPTEVNKSSPPKSVTSPDKESPQMISSPEQLTPRMTSRHPILDLRLSAELDESPRTNSSPEQETLRLGRAHSPEASKQMISDETGSLHPTGRSNILKQENGVIHDVCAAGDTPVPIIDSRVGLMPDKTDKVPFLDPVQLNMTFDNCQSERNYAMPTITQRSIGYLTTTESRTLSKPGVSTSKMF
ncbi:Cyclin-dependent kinase 2 [Fasciola gigantica]|uniref:cyclin-dependent kinase n=1 Tax=Fasciola gigantica TaxID=46835 RepID=A0A504YUU5_FASGI|nr:Cyclin-dependent kinase 2 [Fasciola gigantica]